MAVMWYRSPTRRRDVFLGVVIALGLMGLVVMWNNTKQSLTVENTAEGVHASALNRPVNQIIEAKPATPRNVQRDDFNEHTVNEIIEDKPDTQENKQKTLHDETVSNDGSSFPNEEHSQSEVHEAYSHLKAIVFFIGYSRSRHSLLGSLMDAHPHMVVSDEQMAFGKWKKDPEKYKTSIYEFYDVMFKASQRAVAQGRRSGTFEGSVANATSRFKYYVPNQWQGNYDKYIEVIGDKAGAYTAWKMKSKDGADAVRLLEKTSGAKVKFVHVVRNPFDNIATMVLEHRNVKERYGEHKEKVKAPEELEEKIKFYFSMAEGSSRARQALPDSVIDIPSMEIVKNPVQTLSKICKFLEITCTDKYLQDCAATVDPVPSITRDFIEWTPEQKNTVYKEMKKYDFFEGYSFDK